MHLLTGGQRIDQLVRLRWSDVRPDSITFHDGAALSGWAAQAVGEAVDSFQLKRVRSGVENSELVGP